MTNKKFARVSLVTFERHVGVVDVPSGGRVERCCVRAAAGPSGTCGVIFLAPLRRLSTDCLSISDFKLFLSERRGIRGMLRRRLPRITLFSFNWTRRGASPIFRMQLLRL
jgi:hypothetical protein